MGKIQSGIAQGHKIGQGNHVEIIVGTEIEAQVDGEPFKIPPSKILVEHHNQAPVVINSNKDKFGGQQARLTTESRVSPSEIKKYQQEVLKRLEECKGSNNQDELNSIQDYIKNVNKPLELLELLDSRIKVLNPNRDPLAKPKRKKKTNPSEDRKLTHSADQSPSRKKSSPLNSSGLVPDVYVEKKKKDTAGGLSDSDEKKYKKRRKFKFKIF